MRPRIALKRLSPLLRAPSFTSRDASRLGVTASTLAHYVRRGELERVARGLYRAVGAPAINDFRWADLIAAVQSAKEGTICLTSALAVYGLTEEMPRQHWIAIRNSTRHRAVLPTRVIRMRNFDLGRAETKISGVGVPIYDRERTIVDAFRYLGKEAALKALKMAVIKKRTEQIDIDKIRKYAHQLRAKIEPYLLAVTT